MALICTQEKVEKLRVVHYGSKMYDIRLFNKVKNDRETKPKGGLWTSPLISTNGWRSFCLKTRISTCTFNNSFLLGFYPKTKILVIDLIQDMVSIPVYEFEHEKFGIDFEKLVDHYDGIWLTARGQEVTKDLYPLSFRGWDCETVLILNKHCCYQVR